MVSGKKKKKIMGSKKKAIRKEKPIDLKKDLEVEPLNLGDNLELDEILKYDGPIISIPDLKLKAHDLDEVWNRLKNQDKALEAKSELDRVIKGLLEFIKGL